MTTHGSSIRYRCQRAIAFCITLCLLLSHSMGVVAQGIPDIEAPLVELEFVDVSTADTTQVFTVQAFDDIGLGDVSLHHRRAGENVFTKTLMDPVGDTGYFSVAIDTDPSDLRSFEYYAQALDLNGNRTVSGFAFDPFVREISKASGQTLATDSASEAAPANDTQYETTVSELEQNTPSEKPAQTNNKRYWLYAVLGVLAVGAAASQLGGSGGSSDGSINTGDETLVPLTVTIGDPIP